MRQSEFLDAQKFFEFCGARGARWWFVEAQPRKQNGQRGAPIGRFFGARFAVYFDKVPAKFLALARTLERAGKRQVDLQTRESPALAGARDVLVDDVDGFQLDPLRAWWPGAGAILETSPSNFQAVLLSPRTLTDGERARLAHAAAIRFEGDLGAAGAGQLHRFPGSPNFKRSALVNGQPFCCRLVSLFDGESPAFSVSELLAEVPSNLPTEHHRVGRRAAVETAAGDNSARAFAWTLDQLRNGVSHDEILAGLRAAWLSHHDPVDWPARTLANALHALGQAPSRYSSRSLD